MPPFGRGGLARVREAGATKRCNVKLREMIVEVVAIDEREIEVQASLPKTALWLHARRDTEHKYVKLFQSDRCRLVVVGMETGGRWSTEALQLVEMLAAARTGGTACPETFSFLGVDTTMVAHILTEFSPTRSFRLRLICKAQMDHRLIWRTCSRSGEQVRCVSLDMFF